MIPFADQKYNRNIPESCDPRGLRGGSYIQTFANGDHVSFLDVKPFGSTNTRLIDYSVKIKIYPTSTQQAFCWFGNIGGTLGAIPSLRWKNSKFELYSTLTGYVPTSTYALNNWYEIEIFYDHVNDLQTLFINGAQALQIVGNQNNGSITIRSMNSVLGVSNFFIGRYAKYGVYDANGVPAIELNFEEETGATYYDQSGQNLNGTKNGNITRTNDLSLYSDRDNFGYSKSGGVYYLQDRSNPEYDVLGNQLQFTGKACGV